jgi:nucleoside-diphosphate-sugar epimerase
MKRTQFIVIGRHVLLPIVIGHLIREGFALIVDPSEVNVHQPKFIVCGAEVHSREAVDNLMKDVQKWSAADWPVLLLSSSSVYSDRDQALNLRDIEPMDEAQGHVITSPLDESAVRPITALLVEHLFVQREKGKTIVVRPFNVYGPNCHHGVVNKFIAAAAKDEPLTVYTPGRQIRTFLYEDDFTNAISALVARLLKGQRGIYNVGSDEQVEILSLAKSIGHAYEKELTIQNVETTERHVWWKLPAVDRILIDARWRAKTSLRSGVFQMVRGGK